MVTHDLGVIAEMCDEIIVLYGGRVCERGTADEIFYNPKHEYTKGLLRSIPDPGRMADGNGGVFKSDKSTGYFDYEAINNDYEGTLDEARKLLEAAGYKFGDDGMLSSDTPIEVTYLTNNGTGHIAVAESM